MKLNTFKKGATSIYVVVIATLLFSVITFSFIRIIINEVAKTTSDELAQAAYDSALAGVEDAKTALKRYYECIESGGGENGPEGCGDANSGIIGYIQKGFKDDSDCDAVSWALGRFSTSSLDDDGLREVLIQEQSTTGGNRQNIVQAYTCVVIDNTLDDYRSTLSSSTPIRVIPLKTADADSITGILIRWYTEDDGSLESLNYNNEEWYYPTGGTANGKPLPTPPTLSATIIQTGDEFKLEDFNSSSNGTTNRGTVILTPTKNGNLTHISSSVVLDSNNHDYNRTSHNSPQKIKCQAGFSDEFACVTTIELPKPIGGTRRKSDDNEGTFFLILSLPYGNPTTTFSVQLCNDNDGGTRGDCKLNDNSTPSIAEFKDVQISVDSTGRANDMYSRVEARVELNDVFFPFPEFAISATGDGNDTLKKNFYITSNCIDSSNPNNIVDCSNTND